jgi:outer membrane immunogenic protein
LKLKIIVAALAVAAPLFAANASQAATPGATLEIGYTRADFASADSVPSFGFNTVELRGGVQFHKNFGAELEGGFGLGSDTVHVDGVGVSVKQDWQVAVYGVGYLPVGHNADLFARVGYGRTQVTASADGYSLAGQSNGAAAGVGFRQFPGGGKNGWRVDYTHYFYNGEPVDTFGAAYVRKF